MIKKETTSWADKYNLEGEIQQLKEKLKKKDKKIVKSKDIK